MLIVQLNKLVLKRVHDCEHRAHKKKWRFEGMCGLVRGGRVLNSQREVCGGGGKGGVVYVYEAYEVNQK